ncbi:MAG: ArsB/NhaD family transporter [Methanomicrobiales archaeon]|nr:ArsB/NhaD family transporter [Methanomicrobiales archaeon]
MPDRLAVVILFAITSALTIFFILRRPYLKIRLFSRDIVLESYIVGSLLGPTLIVAFGILTYDQILLGVTGDSTLNPLGILLLFLSLVFLSIFLDITGFFEFCARMALKFAGCSGVRLFFALYATVSLLTIVTSNDIIVLTFTPFIYYFAREAGINPRPYLFAEFFAANTWSMMLYLGNPTNILVATAFRIRFDAYTGWMILPTLAAGTASAALLYLVFRKEIAEPLQHRYAADPRSAITDGPGAALGISLLFGCIIALAVAPYAGIELHWITLAFALTLLCILALRDSYAACLRRETATRQIFAVPATLRRMPWAVVPFLLSLFITVEALSVYGISGEVAQAFASICGGSDMAYVFLFGTASALSANVLNNIPMTVAFIPVVGMLPGEGLTAAALATVVGSNLGANLTPLGSLAGIMWIGLLQRREISITYREFVRVGLLVTPVTLAACLAVLALETIIF